MRTFLESLGLDPDKPLVAILPGSRINEVRAILPRLLDAAKIIHGRLPAAQFVLARAPHLGDELFSELARGGPAITMVANATDDVLAAADVGLLASGTVTVQAALRECPMIVVYRLSPLTYRLGRRFVHVNTFAMANLVAGRHRRPRTRAGRVHTGSRRPRGARTARESGARSGDAQGTA